MKAFATPKSRRAGVLALAGLLVGGFLVPFEVVQASGAEILYVNNETESRQSPTCEQAAYSSIHSAIEAAAAGDTIHVCAGLYQEGPIYFGVDLTIVGDGPGKTILDGEYPITTGGLGDTPVRDRILISISDTTPSLNLESLTLRNGLATAGAAVYVAGDLTLTDVTASGNSAEFAGGAVWATGTVTIEQSTFETNSVLASQIAPGEVVRPAQIERLGGAVYGMNQVVIADSTFQDNEVRGEFVGGGAVAGSEVTVHRSDFTGNGAAGTSEALGGAILATNLQILDSNLLANHAATTQLGGLGGAIFVGNLARIERCTLSGNSAEQGAAAYGGAILLLNGTVEGNAALEGAATMALHTEVVYSTIANNVANGTGTRPTGLGTAAAAGPFATRTPEVGATEISPAVVIGASILTNNRLVEGRLEDLAAQAEGIEKNCSGDETDIGGNLATGTEAGGWCQFTNPTSANVTAAQLDLGRLRLNSPGRVQTMALGAGSIARDVFADCFAGTQDDLNPWVDARGVARPQGGSCDAGAYEYRRTSSGAEIPVVVTPPAAGPTLPNTGIA